jgi:hypothetical protein
MNLLLPVELKLATRVRGDWGRGPVDPAVFPDRIKPRDLRPVQIQWHDNLARAGAKSCLLLGVPQPSGGFHCWLQPNCGHGSLKHWRKGFDVPSLLLVATDAGLNTVEWKRRMALG